MKKFEYASVEWLWGAETMRINYGNGREEQITGSYDGVINLLNSMGQESWELVGAVSGSNWIYWTLKREIL